MRYDKIYIALSLLEWINAYVQLGIYVLRDYQATFRRLSDSKYTFAILFLKFHPIFKDDFEFFEDQVMCEAIPPWVPLHKIVFVRCIFFQSTIQMDTIPMFLKREYQ